MFSKAPSIKNGKYNFSHAPNIFGSLNRTMFSLDFSYKTTLNADYLYPVLMQEVLPGDTFTLNVSDLTRLATPIVPVMDNLYCRYYFFFVPNRLVWNNWVKFMGEQDNPTDTTDYLIPSATSSQFPVGSLHDYFGLPVLKQGYKYNVLPFRAYNLIWNTWFRDQNLQNSIPVVKADSGDNLSTFVLRKKNKTHDLFTSALPFAQKGLPVSLPLGGSAPVSVNAKNFPLTTSNSSLHAGSLDIRGRDSSGMSNVVVTNYISSVANLPEKITEFQNVETKGTKPFTLTSTGNLLVDGLTGTADLSSTTAITLNMFRLLALKQQYLELDARGGTRYIEKVFSHFGVVSQDYRVQNPEYLGGFKFNLHFSQVPQTSGTANTPQGNLSAFAYGTNQMNSVISKSFTEHGMIIGLKCIYADLTYSQGLDRYWSKSNVFDFYFPIFNNVGEIGIKNKELVLTGSAKDDQIFGYQEAWYEYRTKRNMITGLMRPSVDKNVAIWNLSQLFGDTEATSPLLNSAFIENNTPISRVVAVPDQPNFISDTYFNLKAVRVMLPRSVPGITRV